MAPSPLAGAGRGEGVSGHDKVPAPSVIPAKAGIQRKPWRRRILVTEEPVTHLAIASRGVAGSHGRTPHRLPAWGSAATPSPLAGPGRGEGVSGHDKEARAGMDKKIC